jgi:hypothetical protein
LVEFIGGQVRGESEVMGHDLLRFDSWRKRTA